MRAFSRGRPPHTRPYYLNVLRAERIESVLGGSDRCKFRIRIPDDVLVKYID